VALRELGALQLETGRADEAVPLLRESLEIHRQAYSDTSRATAITEGLLGAGLTAQGAYPEAEEHLLRTYDTWKDQNDSTNSYLQTTLSRLATLYEAWGKSEEAARYQSELVLDVSPQH
jgi:tetratricopeptide (TPR) repeat protein